MESFDRDSIVAELRRVATKLGKPTLSKREINRHARVSANTVLRRFGSVKLAYEAAGLIPPKPRLTNEEILAMLVVLWRITWRESGRSPSLRELKTCGFPVSGRAIRNHFGSWKKALLAAAASAPDCLTEADVESAPPKPERQKISDRKRFLVFQRDGYQCQICRKTGVELELDHVIPVCRGGSDEMDNLQTLCRPCNAGKSGSLQ
jgi:hypothetical protein